MSDHYILEGRELKKVDLMTWARWFETADRHIAKTDVGDYWVSTVFLGLDHSFGEGRPLLFETMAFHRSDISYEERRMAESYSDRCSTYEEAEAMHEKACAYVREKLLS